MDVFFIGDYVRTPRGNGYITKVTTWRDRIVELSDHDAIEFSDHCFRLCGVDYKESWLELDVDIGDRIVILERKDVELIDGRGSKGNSFSAKVIKGSSKARQGKGGGIAEALQRSKRKKSQEKGE